MPKVTSKLQITLPKALATQYGIEPGDEIDFQAMGESIRLTPRKIPGKTPEKTLRPRLSLEERIRIWTEANQVLRAHWDSEGLASQSVPSEHSAPSERGWTRDELYDRVNRIIDRSEAKTSSVEEGVSDSPIARADSKSPEARSKKKRSK